MVHGQEGPTACRARPGGSRIACPWGMGSCDGGKGSDSSRTRSRRWASTPQRAGGGGAGAGAKHVRPRSPRKGTEGGSGPGGEYGQSAQSPRCPHSDDAWPQDLTRLAPRSHYRSHSADSDSERDALGVRIRFVCASRRADHVAVRRKVSPRVGGHRPGAWLTSRAWGTTHCEHCEHPM